MMRVAALSASIVGKHAAAFIILGSQELTDLSNSDVSLPKMDYVKWHKDKGIIKLFDEESSYYDYRDIRTKCLFMIYAEICY